MPSKAVKWGKLSVGQETEGLTQTWSEGNCGMALTGQVTDTTKKGRSPEGRSSRQTENAGGMFQCWLTGLAMQTGNVGSYWEAYMYRHSHEYNLMKQKKVRDFQKKKGVRKDKCPSHIKVSVSDTQNGWIKR